MTTVQEQRGLDAVCPGRVGIVRKSEFRPLPGLAEIARGPESKCHDCLCVCVVWIDLDCRLRSIDGEFGRVAQRKITVSHSLHHDRLREGCVRGRECIVKSNGTIEEIPRPCIVGSGTLAHVPKAALICFPSAKVLRRLSQSTSLFGPKSQE